MTTSNNNWLAAVKTIETNSTKIIEDMRQSLYDRELHKVPHGMGWGLGSELDYMMKFQVIPAVTKQKLEYLSALKHQGGDK